MPTPEPNRDELTNGEDYETLERLLPHVDMTTALTHRIIKRDPIAGLGTESRRGKENVRHTRTQSLGHRTCNPILVAFEVDDVAERKKTKTRNVQTPVRDPIALTGELGEEVDTLRTTGRPRSAMSREPQRDPISGTGNFGDKEWDPIWKYNGRFRRSKSSNGLRSNPLTGENLKTFDIMMEGKSKDPKLPNGSEFTRPSRDSSKNILTGDNCSTYTVTPGMRSPRRRLPSANQPSRNAITGENCVTYDINAEIGSSKTRPLPRALNPLIGENTNVYMVSQEEKQRTSKPYVYKNTVTGENLKSYKISPIERCITAKPQKERHNPLSGENLKTYIYRMGETDLPVKKRDISSPLTGTGSRGQTYTVSIEERSTAPRVNGLDDANRRVRARSSGPFRNVLTGTNCETYFVSQEMRSERCCGHNASNGPGFVGATYNILTGV